VAFLWCGETQLQAMLGFSVKEDRANFDVSISKGRPIWVISGRRENEPKEFPAWLQSKRKLAAKVEEVERSADLPRADGWPEQLTLFKVTPSDH